ncbi:hypothetical protein BC936DRAFT_141503 [Jimgerdemannia flammicorona]|uniref:Uncharacterized protein n=2 Tax=Jimgerdemannia flammicorona TaxID=994334 RepID=A0A433DG08_9FUNG|nr:hypothetical protein BC936DRAFT_141503 [Jimgerdemannia flammicorona]RUS32223.1 hypothetical protein BC938DRAFT_475999 [Jimgerdemannia flammicorona]
MAAAPFDIIPHELVCIILHTTLHFVSADFFWSARHVCRTWRDIVDAEILKMAAASFGRYGEARLEILALSGTETTHYIGITTHYTHIDFTTGLVHFDCASPSSSSSSSSTTIVQPPSATILHELSMFKLILNDRDDDDCAATTSPYQTLVLYPYHDSTSISMTPTHTRSQKVFCYIDILLSPARRRFRRTSEFPKSEEVAGQLGATRELRWRDVVVVYRMRVVGVGAGAAWHVDRDAGRAEVGDGSAAGVRPMVGVEFMEVRLKVEQVLSLLSCGCEMGYPAGR